MRLNNLEINDLISSISQHIELTDSQLRLYGSRTKDEAKGGDIDLLLIVPDELYQKVINLKYDILVSIKGKLDDQKIDLLIVKKSELNTNPFLKIIYPESITLKEWPAQ